MPPPKTLLLLRSQGLTQSEDADSKPRAQSGRPGDSPVLAIGARRPTEDGANVTLRAGPTSTLETGEPTGDPPRRRIWEGRGEKTLETLTTSTAVLRLFLSRLGSPSVFSFGPTSGAQRCLIVRDWEPAVPPLERSAAHAGNASPARRAAYRSALPLQRPAHFRRRSQHARALQRSGVEFRQGSVPAGSGSFPRL